MSCSLRRQNSELSGREYKDGLGLSALNSFTYRSIASYSYTHKPTVKLAQFFQVPCPRWECSPWGLPGGLHGGYCGPSEGQHWPRKKKGTSNDSCNGHCAIGRIVIQRLVSSELQRLKGITVARHGRNMILPIPVLLLGAHAAARRMLTTLNAIVGLVAPAESISRFQRSSWPPRVSVQHITTKISALGQRVRQRISLALKPYSKYANSVPGI